MAVFGSFSGECFITILFRKNFSSGDSARLLHRAFKPGSNMNCLGIYLAILPLLGSLALPQHQTSRSYNPLFLTPCWVEVVGMDFALLGNNPARLRL